MVENVPSKKAVHTEKCVFLWPQWWGETFWPKGIRTKGSGMSAGNPDQKVYVYAVFSLKEAIPRKLKAVTATASISKNTAWKDLCPDGSRISKVFWFLTLTAERTLVKTVLQDYCFGTQTCTKINRCQNIKFSNLKKLAILIPHPFWVPLRVLQKRHPNG